jgi:DNA repair protein RadD
MIRPRWYQEECVAALFKYILDKPTGSPIVALPTATGKSVIIAMFIISAIQWWRTPRFIVATHVQELVEHDAKAIWKGWPDAPVGLFSAGLGRSDTAMQVIVGGIQSMVKSPLAFGWRDVLFIDEAHLLSPKQESQYAAFIDGLRSINPNLIVIGLTATPYRMGQGLLTEKIGDDHMPLFTDIAYDLTTIEAFDRLIREGHLSPPIPKRTKLELDVHDVSVLNTGEFNMSQLQGAVDKAEITFAALRELCEHGYNRKSWMVFASGVEHADHVATMLNSFGVPCGVIHNGIKPNTRRETIEAFKSGELRCLSNNNVLTTGFDHPPIDLIGVLRPTRSVVLHVQMIGRGMRPSPETGKTDCLVLDFARNTVNLGPINDPKRPKRGKKTDGDMPVKVCENCGTYNHTRAVFCIGCGEQFSFAPKITKTAGTAELLRGGAPILDQYKVTLCTYAKHHSRSDGKPPTLKVTYICGLKMFTKYVPFESDKHGGRAMAKEWWMQRHASECPTTVDEALRWQSLLRTPTHITVHVNKEYPSVEQELFQ